MHKTSRRGFAIVAMIWSSCAWGYPGSRLNAQLFREYVHQFRDDARGLRLEHPVEMNKVIYLPTVLLEASQTRYSFWKMRESMVKVTTKKSGNYYDKKIFHWRFGHAPDAHGVGRSLFPVEKYLIGLVWRGRIFLTDGHHKAMIASYLNAPMVPIMIKHDFSDDTEAQFLERMNEVVDGQRLAYWRDYLGNEVRRVDLADMTDDPNLLLARKLLTRVDAYQLVNPDGTVEFVDKTRVDPKREPQTVLVIKIGNDESYYEARIADALRRHGVRFDDDLRNQPIPKGELYRFHSIIERERDRADSDLKHVLLLDKPRLESKIDVATLITDHVRNPNCAHLLERRVRAND